MRLFGKRQQNFLNKRAGNLGRDECLDVMDFMGRIGDCTALRTKTELIAATAILESLGLPSHHDPKKNWDMVKCLYHIVETDDLDAPILDVGASADSAILRLLSMLGYRNLRACDVRGKGSEKYEKVGIEFSVADLTRTTYPDDFFQVITSISVIEHGVPLDAYVREMSRILRPGGVLLTTTDFWPTRVDCTGIYPYGEGMGEMKVFSARELEDFCGLAQKHGLVACGPLNLETKDRVIRWERVDREYTFAFVALRKREV